MIDVDDDELRIKYMFWVGARSRATYQSFRNVVTFDKIYLTNTDNMPFAPFVSISQSYSDVN